jgi:hypothetical protein
MGKDVAGSLKLLYFPVILNFIVVGTMRTVQNAIKY